LGIRLELDAKNPIGNLLQAWLGKWLESKNIYYHDPASSQEFPDFLLQKNDANGLLEF
jgi:hypothetical protein